MTTTTASLLEEMAQREGLELRARHDYVARGGYGKATSAVVVDSWGTLLRVACAVAREADDDANFEILIDDLGRARSDNMGRDSIIVY